MHQSAELLSPSSRSTRARGPRRASRLLSGTLAASVSLLIGGLVAAPSALAVSDLPVAPVPAAVSAVGDGDPDAFTFDSFDAVYTLGRDASGASTLTTVETLVAEFPQTDQNKGIRRGIPVDYDGHPTDLDVVSVTDDQGRDREYSTDTDDGFEVLTIAGDDYVRGTQTYVITYREKNVTRAFADTGADEFYRDVNGTAWKQPFGTVAAKVVVEGDLAASLNGDTACYRGVQGSTTSCSIDRSPDGSLSIGESDLGPGENVTFAVGFVPGTFAPYDASFGASGLVPVFIAGLTALLAALVAAIVARRTTSADAPGRGTIVAEFEPPQEPELALVGALIGKKAKVVPAVLVSFAVRRFARIVETDGKYSLQYTGEEMSSRRGAGHGLAPNENRIAKAFFGRVLTPGETAPLSKPSDRATSGVVSTLNLLDAQVLSTGLRRPMPRKPVILVGALSVVAILLLGATGFGLLGQERAGLVAALALLLAVAALFVPFIVVRQPLTEAGAAVRDHVKGIDLYLRVAEEERIRVLQSVRGAERVEADGEQVVKIYERLLPYAVLLGVDKSWSKVLGAAYERAGYEPDWYSGANGFTVAGFASGIGSMSSSTASSAFTGGSSGSSSSFGGSTGGGFSGGGGGGGGGGGV